MKKKIANLLEDLAKQNLKTVKIGEIIVVSSGSIDNTNTLVNSYVKKSEDSFNHSKKRQGKASAVSLFLKQAKNHFVVIMSGDLLLKNNTIENLVSPLADSTVGIVGLPSRKYFRKFQYFLPWMRRILSL